MKAVVVEIKGRSAVVLSKNGQFIKVHCAKEMKVGSEIDLPEKRTWNLYGGMLRMLAAAAVFIVTLGVSYGVYSYTLPYSYINVDINPSLEIVANRYDRILKVEAINADGASVLENQQFKNQKVEVAVEEIIKKASDKGYIKEDVSDAVLLTVSSKEEKKTADVEKIVQEAAEAKIESAGMKADVVVEKATLEQHDEARKLDMSPGKLVLIGKLQDVQPQAAITEYKNAPVKTILEAIHSKKAEEKTPEKEEQKNTKTPGKETPKASPVPQKKSGTSVWKLPVEENKKEDKGKTDKNKEWEEKKKEEEKKEQEKKEQQRKEQQKKEQQKKEEEKKKEAGNPVIDKKDREQDRKENSGKLPEIQQRDKKARSDGKGENDRKDRQEENRGKGRSR